MSSLEDILGAGSAIFGDIQSIFSTLLNLGSSIIGS